MGIWRHKASVEKSPRSTATQSANSVRGLRFPAVTIRAYPFDRLLIAGAVALIIIPLLIYTWIAAEANIEAQIQLTQDLNHGIVRTVAAQIDVQCDGAKKLTGDLAVQASTMSALRARDARTLSDKLRLSVRHMQGAQYAAAYDGSGSLVSDSPAGSAPRMLSDITRKRSENGVWFAGATARPSTKPVSPAILAIAPVRDRSRTVGFISVAFSVPHLPVPRSALYLADADGWLMAYAGIDSPPRQLKSYTPMRYALSGITQSLICFDPTEREEVFAGYTAVPTPKWGAVLTQPLTTAFSPTRFLLQKLAFLLLPVFGLALALSWNRIRSTRQIEALAERLAAQNEGLRAADRARTVFLANASHDLRTPLTCIQISLSGLLDSDLRMPKDQIVESLNSIGSEVDQLTARVRNLLDMTRLESGAGSMRRETEDLTAIVSSALERVGPLIQGREIRADFPPEPLLLDCDQSQIETVIVNLVENAVKYSPKGSLLTIRGWKDGGVVGFSLRDQGIGIAEGEETRVFEKFYRSTNSAPFEGSGLGLAICKTIVDAHGGKISARSPSEGGSEFSFTLPALENYE